MGSLSVTVKINGTVSHVLSYVDPVKEEGGGFWDWLNGIADSIVQAEVDLILKPIIGAFKAGIAGIINLLNENSLEIITFGVIGCSVGMIVAPIMGSNSGTWFGRVVFVILAGAVWRLLI